MVTDKEDSCLLTELRFFSLRPLPHLPLFSPLDNLLVFLVWVVVGTVTAVVLGLTLLISLVLVVLYRRKHAKRNYTG